MDSVKDELLSLQLYQLSACAAALYVVAAAEAEIAINTYNNRTLNVMFVRIFFLFFSVSLFVQQT